MSELLQVILIISIISYIIGSIPFGYILVKLLKNIDVRDQGSQSTGATNVSRILGIKWALLVVILDILKIVIPLLIIKNYINPCFPNEYLIPYHNKAIIITSTLFFAILGHIYPVFLKFKGGKGVASYIGGILILYPIPALIFLASYICILLLTRITSVTSIFMVTIFPLILFLIEKKRSWVDFSILILLSILIIYTHRSNILRLIHGKEPKLNLFKK